jgi:FkbM family methyltransferase
MSNTFLQASISIEPVFRLVKRTWIDRLYQSAYADRTRLNQIQRLKGHLAKSAFKLLRNYGRHAQGLAEVKLPDHSSTFHYHAANTQFHSLYMPVYHMGYEPETGALLKLLLNRSSCFFDIGSNWGYFSIFAAACGFKGEIRAFELQPGVYADLRQVVSEVGLDAAVLCENIGLSDQRGRSGVHIPDGLHSGIGQMSEGDEVEVLTLDDYLASKPDLLKIDVEGAEAQVLRGGNEVLRQCRPWVVFESWCNRGDLNAGLEPLHELAGKNYQFYQPVLMQHDEPFAHYHAYGQYWDVQKKMLLRLVPFTLGQRQLMMRHFNVLACPVERLAELQQVFRDNHE